MDRGPYSYECGPFKDTHMAKDFAEKFYKSKKWQKTREAYFKSKRGLCERCLAKGLIVPGEIVHHRQWLTPDNIHDPNITLNWDNLEVVCRECHSKEHDLGGAAGHTKRQRRYFIDANGRAISKKD